MQHIVLASSSPRRQELLRLMGIEEFEVRIPVCDESYPDGLTPEEIVSMVSRQKSLATNASDDEIVISADTMVFLNDLKLGKPKDEATAFTMLKSLQGQQHKVCTGVTVRQGTHTETESKSTIVHFLPLSDEVLHAYVATGEPMDKAGAYGIQGKGALLVDYIEGDYYNVVGLPVALLSKMLMHFHYPVFDGGVY